MKVIQLANENKLVIKTNSGASVIPVSDIVYVRSDNNYSIFILSDQKELLVANTLKNVEEILESLNYVRCHNSYLVNVEYVSELSCKGKMMLRLRNSDNIPVSRKGLKRIKLLFGI